MKHIEEIGCVAVTWVGAYLLGCIVMWSANPGEWVGVVRFLIVFLALFVSVLQVCEIRNRRILARMYERDCE